MIMCYHKYRSGFSYIISIPRGYPGEINNNSSRIKPSDGASGGFLIKVDTDPIFISLIIIV